MPLGEGSSRDSLAKASTRSAALGGQAELGGDLGVVRAEEGSWRLVQSIRHLLAG